jgi:hypothetical protein
VTREEKESRRLALTHNAGSVTRDADVRRFALAIANPSRCPFWGAPSSDEVTALQPGVRDPITWARSPSLSLVREERAQPEAVPSRLRARYH